MKVVDINCDTPLESFIDIDTLKADLDYIYENLLKKIKDSIKDIIDSEIKNGGLDEYSLNIGGKPILQETSINVQSGLDQICTDLKKIKEDILAAAKEHKKSELNQYISVLNIKLTNIQSELNKIQAQINEESSIASLINGHQSDKKRQQNLQQYYSQKLETAKEILKNIN